MPLGSRKVIPEIDELWPWLFSKFSFIAEHWKYDDPYWSGLYTWAGCVHYWLVGSHFKHGLICVINYAVDINIMDYGMKRCARTHTNAVNVPWKIFITCCLSLLVSMEWNNNENTLCLVLWNIFHPWVMMIRWGGLPP